MKAIKLHSNLLIITNYLNIDYIKYNANQDGPDGTNCQRDIIFSALQAN